MPDQQQLAANHFILREKYLNTNLSREQLADVMKEGDLHTRVVVHRFRFLPQATKHVLACWHLSRRRAPRKEAQIVADVLRSCADAVVSLLRSLCRCICLGSASPPSHQQIRSALLPNTEAWVLLPACAHSCLDSMSSRLLWLPCCVRNDRLL